MEGKRQVEEIQEGGEKHHKKVGINGCDESYFRSYGDISVHRDMLADHKRTFSYRMAILRNYDLIRGKVVLDVGAGTGILSMFCVHAGAKKVYSIEASEMANQARRVIEENKMADRISVIHGKVEETDLPEQVDVIVSEWMGYFLLYESMLPSVLYARDKWLKEGGVILPSTATMYLAAYAGGEAYEENLDFWDDLQGVYKVNMSAMRPYAQQCLTRRVQVCSTAAQDIVSRAAVVCRLQLATVTTEQLNNVKGKFELDCFGDSRVFGFACWFDVLFPKNVTLSTSPYTEETHWSQCVLYVERPFEVKQDTRITGTLHITPSNKYNRFLDISLDYEVDASSSSQRYLMDDFIT